MFISILLDFNWKQRKILGLDLPREPEEVTHESFGRFEDLLKDERYKGGTLVDVPEDYFTIQTGKIPMSDKSKKIVDVSKLFGASKSSGPAVVLKERERFSHTRVFGSKKLATTLDSKQ